ncbi:MAG: protein-glutamine glutaminase family protein [Bacteriovoracaceae bacterium]
MNIIKILFLASLAQLAHAEVITGHIHSVDLGKQGEDHLVKLSNGRVIFLPYKEKSLAIELKNKIKDNIEIKSDRNGRPISFKSLNQNEEFEPTIIQGSSEAQRIFERLNSKYQRDSQCFNRAHVWAFEEFKKNGIKSTKTFVFFTASYLRDYRFSWWFHVAPTIHVNENGNIIERVLDQRFSFGPLTIKEWTDLFVYTGRPCPLITKFSEYDVNPQTENCYLMKGSMYYWQPGDFVNQEKTGYVKNEFRMSDVNSSYAAGFK